MYTQGHTARFTHFYASRDGTSKSGPSGEQNLYDKVVDAAGGGDSTSIQTGLDSAGDSSTVLVKSGSYTENINSTNTNVKVVVEPGTTVTGTVTLTGDCNTWQMGAGGTITGLITIAGDTCSYLGKNGGDLAGVAVTGASCYVTGGGWGSLSDGTTLVDGIDVSGADVIISNISAQTTAGGASTVDGIGTAGVRTTISNCKVVDSDDISLLILSGADDGLIIGCTTLGSDADGIVPGAGQSRIIGNYVTAAASNGIRYNTNADNSLGGANVVGDITSASVDIHTAGEDCCFVGNRTDGAVSDSSATSTVASNEETVF